MQFRAIQHMVEHPQLQLLTQQIQSSKNTKYLSDYAVTCYLLLRPLTISKYFQTLRKEFKQSKSLIHQISQPFRYSLVMY